MKPCFRVFTAAQESDLIAAHRRAREAGKGDRIARVKLFGLGKMQSWTWFLSEYDPDERIFFGLVESAMCEGGEWGYVSRDEVEAMMSPAAVMRFAWVERDLHWTPKEIVDADELVTD